MSDIQDEAYTEAMDEIKALRRRLEDMMADRSEGLSVRDAEIKRLRALLLLAADALEKHSIAIAGEVRDVIAELRKVAQ
jgi:hypothetical protein